MISKFEAILQELDETTYWFELLIDGEIITPSKLEPLYNEANELIAMFVAAVKKLKRAR